VKAVTEKLPNRLPGSGELLLLVAMMDVNADGVIRLDEVPDRLRPVYLRIEQRIGQTGDRKIRARDLAQAAPMVSQIAVAAVERLGLDVDLEMSLLPEKNFALIDALERPPRPGDRLADPEQAAETFRLLDANGDGQIAYQEVPEQFADRFDRLLRRADANRDGRVSRQEFDRMSRRMQAFRGTDRMSSPPAGDAQMMAE
jgi:Ca2+-binding EF-hand superfamily protein